MSEMMKPVACKTIEDCTTPKLCMSVGTCKGYYVMPASVRESASTTHLQPVAWTLTSELQERETTCRAHLWFVDPQNSAWSPLYTAAQLQEAARLAVPDEPPLGLLMSMAIRYDHGLGMPGFYDSPIYAGAKLTHEQRLKSTIAIMRQLWEEVVGKGFYRHEKEDDYRALADVAGEKGVGNEH